MLSDILYYIFLFPLEQLLGIILVGLIRALHDAGIAIIVLSLLVNLFLLKIFLYTDKKAEQEKVLKEQLDSRIKSWKNVFNKAKVFAFTRTLYAQHKYHPIYALRSLGGLALQIPFFITMFLVINKANYLQSVNFLWIQDLSKPDIIFGIHLLPILMTIFTLINVFYLSKDIGGRIQGSLIAFVFLILLYNMPSALVLYWCSNTLFYLFKTLIMHQKSSSQNPRTTTQLTHIYKDSQ